MDNQIPEVNYKDQLFTKDWKAPMPKKHFSLVCEEQSVYDIESQAYINPSSQNHGRLVGQSFHIVDKANHQITSKDSLKLLTFAQCGQFDKIKIYLENSKDIDVNIWYFSCKSLNLFYLSGLDDWRPIHYAANIGSSDIIELLLKNNANVINLTSILVFKPQIPNINKRYPHHYAALRGCHKSLRLLVPQCWHILDEQDVEGNTALHLATMYSRKEVITFLLESGANSMIKNKQQCPAPIYSKSVEIQELFTKYNVQVTYNFPATVYGQVLRQNSRLNYIQKFLSCQYIQLKQQQNKQGFLDSQAYNNKQIESNLSVEIKHNNIYHSNNKTLKLIQRTQSQVGPSDFQVVELLGKGAFGSVYLVRRKGLNMNLYAMKVLEKETALHNTVVRYTLTEKKILSTIQHPFIIKLHYAFQTRSKLYLVLEYCEGGNLENMIHKRMTNEENTRKYLAELILVLELLHKYQIIYRDLKPQNVVIDSNGHIRLIDFGLAKIGFNKLKTYSICGTYAYMAPEILRKEGHDYSLDWYLLGVLMYECLHWSPPFYSLDKEILQDNILNGELEFKKSISHEAKDLMKKLLQRNPSKRLGFKGDAQEIKNHPFFKDIDWEDVYNGYQSLPIQILSKLKMLPNRTRTLWQVGDNVSEIKLSFEVGQIEQSRATTQPQFKNPVKHQTLETWEFMRLSSRQQDFD